MKSKCYCVFPESRSLMAEIKTKTMAKPIKKRERNYI